MWERAKIEADKAKEACGPDYYETDPNNRAIGMLAEYCVDQWRGLDYRKGIPADKQEYHKQISHDFIHAGCYFDVKGSKRDYCLVNAEQVKTKLEMQQKRGQPLPDFFLFARVTLRWSECKILGWISWPEVVGRKPVTVNPGGKLKSAAYYIPEVELRPQPTCVIFDGKESWWDRNDMREVDLARRHFPESDVARWIRIVHDVKSRALWPPFISPLP